MDRLHKSAGGMLLLSLRTWSIHRLLGRPGRRLQPDQEGVREISRRDTGVLGELATTDCTGPSWHWAWILFDAADLEQDTDQQR